MNVISMKKVLKHINSINGSHLERGIKMKETKLYKGGVLVFIDFHIRIFVSIYQRMNCLI